MPRGPSQLSHQRLERRALLAGFGGLFIAGCCEAEPPPRRSGSSESAEIADGLTVERVSVRIAADFTENCYVVVDEATRSGIIVDPGGAEDQIARIVRDRGLDIKAIVSTHGHFDHVYGVVALLQLVPSRFALHPADQPWLDQLSERAARFGVSPTSAPKIDLTLDHGTELRLGRRVARVLHTPGHSKGSCCLLFAADGVLLAGDTLFAGSVGRTDLDGGSDDELQASIRSHLLPLDGDVRVYPGHGEATTMGREKQSNAFLRRLMG
jgi:hydroxyacylglutathione hydrolase